MIPVQEKFMVGHNASKLFKPPFQLFDLFKGFIEGSLLKTVGVDVDAAEKLLERHIFVALKVVGLSAIGINFRVNLRLRKAVENVFEFLGSPRNFCRV